MTDLGHMSSRASKKFCGPHDAPANARNGRRVSNSPERLFKDPQTMPGNESVFKDDDNLP